MHYNVSRRRKTMPQTETFTLRIPKPLKDGLERLSEATDRSQTYLFTEALQEYLDAQQWQVQAIRAAVKKADSPEALFIPHDQVVARVKKLSAKPKRASR
jgi:predicted transcriptional regulator